MTKRSQFASTQSIGGIDSYQRWLCAVSEANPQKKSKLQEETEEATSDDVSLGKEKRQRQRQGKDLLQLL